MNNARRIRKTELEYNKLMAQRAKRCPFCGAIPHVYKGISGDDRARCLDCMETGVPLETWERRAQ